MTSILRIDGSSGVRRKLEGADAGESGVDRPALLHQRRKSTMRTLMQAFESEIEPYIAPGHELAIENFKRSCRKKLNGLTWEALELMNLQPGESLNEHAVDLAEETFNATED